ncbi:hypothetical protein NDK50_02000 [Paraburkholderia bryophila]|uniref:hypothetical protein n=1 Tax=Paraburkholderia bryophila TaxID=420952 RepID=UPI00234AD767|nr:hypothetical protein [Paraburkholderia bryophila]WCM20273.1 hypothetical protein NDK50_02000 [Paraburkholderia bryophila]
MFISARSTDSSAWANQSPQDSQQTRQTSDHQKIEAMPRTDRDRSDGTQLRGIDKHEQAMPSPTVKTGVEMMSRALAGLPASYASEPTGKLRPDPVKPGVRIDENGRRYISDGVNTYAIRHDRDNRTERVYRPDSPAKPGIPVRLNTHGDYERHGEVGLKGGSRGRELQNRLTRAQGVLESAQAEKRQADQDIATIDAESRNTQYPGTDLTTRKQQAQRNLIEAERKVQSGETQVERVRQDVREARQTMQNELAQLRRSREDGTQLEQTTQREIAQLETTARLGHQSSMDTHYKLQKLQDDLRRIQAANGTLDCRIMTLHAEMDEIPRL